MGRKSKLTEAQWAIIGKRLLDGESARSLGREFGVSEATIRERFSAQHKQVKNLANALVSTELQISQLPISAQISTHNLADKLRSLSNHLASAAEYGAATAHRLSGIAHAKVAEIDDAAPLNAESLVALKGIAALTNMANASSEIGINLLRANKDIVDQLNSQDLRHEKVVNPKVEDDRGGVRQIIKELEDEY